MVGILLFAMLAVPDWLFVGTDEEVELEGATGEATSRYKERRREEEQAG